MNDNESASIGDALGRIAKVLAGMYMTQLGQGDQGVKVDKLNRFGFSNNDIADILGTTANTVGVALHHSRKASKKRPARKAKK